VSAPLRRPATPDALPLPALIVVDCPACGALGVVDWARDDYVRGPGQTEHGICGHCRGKQQLTLYVGAIDGELRGFCEDLMVLVRFDNHADMLAGDWSSERPCDRLEIRDRRMLGELGVGL